MKFCANGKRRYFFSTIRNVLLIALFFVHGRAFGQTSNFACDTTLGGEITFKNLNTLMSAATDVNGDSKTTVCFEPNTLVSTESSGPYQNVRTLTIPANNFHLVAPPDSNVIFRHEPLHSEFGIALLNISAKENVSVENIKILPGTWGGIVRGATGIRIESSTGIKLQGLEIETPYTREAAGIWVRSGVVESIKDTVLSSIPAGSHSNCHDHYGLHIGAYATPPATVANVENLKVRLTTDICANWSNGILVEGPDNRIDNLINVSLGLDLSQPENHSVIPLFVGGTISNIVGLTSRSDRGIEVYGTGRIGSIRDSFIEQTDDYDLAALRVAAGGRIDSIENSSIHGIVTALQLVNAEVGSVINSQLHAKVYTLEIYNSSINSLVGSRVVISDAEGERAIDPYGAAIMIWGGSIELLKDFEIVAGPTLPYDLSYAIALESEESHIGSMKCGHLRSDEGLWLMNDYGGTVGASAGVLFTSLTDQSPVCSRASVPTAKNSQPPQSTF